MVFRLSRMKTTNDNSTALSSVFVFRTCFYRHCILSGSRWLCLRGLNYCNDVFYICPSLSFTRKRFSRSRRNIPDLRRLTTNARQTVFYKRLFPCKLLTVLKEISRASQNSRRFRVSRRQQAYMLRKYYVLRHRDKHVFDYRSLKH